MPKVDLKLYSTAAVGGTKQTTTVTYVNPNASNAVLKEFGQKLNALTTNTYGQTDRIETVNTDTAGSRKQFRDLSVSGAVMNSSATITFNITENEEITPTVFYYSGGAIQSLTPTKGTSEYPTVAKYTVAVPNSTGVMYVCILSGEEFYSEYQRINVS